MPSNEADQAPDGSAVHTAVGPLEESAESGIGARETAPSDTSDVLPIRIDTPVLNIVDIPLQSTDYLASSARVTTKKATPTVDSECSILGAGNVRRMIVDWGGKDAATYSSKGNGKRIRFHFYL